MASTPRSLATDEGLSLLEVVIAMLVFAVLALAILPLAMQSTKLSAGNRDAGSANAFASAQIASIRAAFPDESPNTCSAVRSSARTNAADPAGTGLVANITVAACPSTYPGAITVSVAVRPTVSSTTTISQMASKIVVTTP
ncbi:type IV pilus modification PilV family protein [Microbacterium sp. CJ88]|uniref:type IV pilus modification PilV family protein n=1 Tax=Microbacterium sp. CJ88 TaxID=3445672 RepID=UPI003F655271